MWIIRKMIIFYVNQLQDYRSHRERVAERIVWLLRGSTGIVELSSRVEFVAVFIINSGSVKRNAACLDISSWKVEYCIIHLCNLKS